MAADGSLPWRRELAELRAGLERWARATGRGDVADVRAPASGMANETVLFTLGGRAVVARLAPRPDAPTTFPTCDLPFQARVLDLVRERTSVPVPRVVYLEASEEWLGSPFLVLAAIDGIVPDDSPPYVLTGWVKEASAAERRRLEESSIAALVELHRLHDGDDTAFLRPDAPGDTPLQRQMAFQRSYYDWAREGTTVPVIEHAFDVLEATMPRSDRTVVNWGDSRIGNVMYRDFEPVAVLDWEMATVGPPEVDLGWMVGFHSCFQFVAELRGAPGIPDMFQRDRAVAAYEARAGHDLLDLTWFEGFAELRFAIITIRTAMRNIAFGIQPPPERPDDLIFFAPLLRRLLEDL